MGALVGVALAHLAMDDAALDKPQMVDHQLAQEVVVLVLNLDSEQAVGGKLERVAVSIERMASSTALSEVPPSTERFSRVEPTVSWV